MRNSGKGTYTGSALSTPEKVEQMGPTVFPKPEGTTGTQTKPATLKTFTNSPPLLLILLHLGSVVQAPTRSKIPGPCQNRSWVSLHPMGLEYYIVSHSPSNFQNRRLGDTVLPTLCLHSPYKSRRVRPDSICCISALSVQPSKQIQ